MSAQEPPNDPDLISEIVRRTVEARKAYRARSPTASKPRDRGLFLSEEEIARRLGQHPSEWTSKARVLERKGFPRIDSLMGGRYWPAIIAWWNRRYGLTSIDISQPDGRDDLDALR